MSDEEALVVAADVIENLARVHQIHPQDIFHLLAERLKQVKT
jgi:hypothetical protein